jgi:hypothetical protein
MGNSPSLPARRLIHIPSISPTTVTEWIIPASFDQKGAVSKALRRAGLKYTVVTTWAMQLGESCVYIVELDQNGMRALFRSYPEIRIAKQRRSVERSVVDSREVD